MFYIKTFLFFLNCVLQSFTQTQTIPLLVLCPENLIRSGIRSGRHPDFKTENDTSVRYSILGLTLSYPQFDCSSGNKFSVVLGQSAFIHRQRLRWNYWYIFPSSPQAPELGQWGLLIEPIMNVWRTVKNACFTLNSFDAHCEFWWGLWMYETSVT